MLPNTDVFQLVQFTHMQTHVICIILYVASCDFYSKHLNDDDDYNKVVPIHHFLLEH